MAKPVTQLSCSNCRGQEFHVAADRGHPWAERMEIKCTGCLSVTVVTVYQPKLLLDWGEDYRGVLCVLENKEG